MDLNIGKALAASFYIVFGVIWVTMTLAIPSGIGPLFTIAGIIVIMLGLRSIFRKPGYSRSFGYCPYCGSPLEKGFKYCGVCGRRL